MKNSNTLRPFYGYSLSDPFDLFDLSGDFLPSDNSRIICYVWFSFQGSAGNKMKWQDRIVLDQNILVGKPIIKGTRLAVEFIIDLLAEGWTETQIVQNYPGLTHEDIQACLGYASNVLHAQKLYPLPS